MHRSGFASLPPLHALAAFEAVARLQSFGKAADELCITHGAVSHRIKLLEKHFGVQLFVRGRRSVSLSAKGTYFLGAVLDALSTLQEASARLSDTAQKTVRISVGPSFSRNWLIERLGDFYRKHPDIDLEISATKMAAADKFGSLRSGVCDVEVRYGKAGEWTGFNAVKLPEGKLFPVCAPVYRKAAGGLAKPRDLLKAVLLRLPHEPWKPWLDAAGLDAAEPARGPLFSDASLMLETAASGQGVALARSLIVDDYLASGRLVKLWNISIPSPHAYFAVFSATAANRPEVKAFADWLVASAAAKQAPAGGSASA
jgi:LysR family glycine cleavage system transcriptional activator